MFCARGRAYCHSEKLEGATVDPAGTNATVRVPGQMERLAGRPERPAEMLFVNIGGIWKLDDPLTNPPRLAESNGVWPLQGVLFSTT
jgi:hypothetical protein